MIPTLILTTVLPAVLAGAGLAFAWKAWERTAETPPGSWGGAAGFAVAFAAGYVGLAGMPPFPPVEATQWLFGFALLAGVLGILEFRFSSIVREILRFVLAAALPVALLRPLVTYSWGLGRGALYLALLGLALVSLSCLVQKAADRNPGPLVPAVLLVVATGTSGLLVFSGSALLGQLAGVVASMAGAALVVTLVAPRVSLAGGATLVATLALAGLWISGFFYAEMPLPSAILAPLALASAALSLLPATHTWPVRRTAVLTALVALALIAAAAGFAAVGYLAGGDEYTPY